MLFKMPTVATTLYPHRRGAQKIEGSRLASLLSRGDWLEHVVGASLRGDGGIGRRARFGSGLGSTICGFESRSPHSHILPCLARSGYGALDPSEADLSRSVTSFIMIGLWGMGLSSA
jgi:hypothetical protein